MFSGVVDSQAQLVEQFPRGLNASDRKHLIQLTESFVYMIRLEILAELPVLGATR